jgi:hypothetical protein
MLHRPALLDRRQSAILRVRMLAEMASLKGADNSASWAKENLPARNILTEEDARIIDDAYREAILKAGTGFSDPSDTNPDLVPPSENPAGGEAATFALLIPKEPGRKRNKAHLLFVGAQPCLICQKAPSDAHHIKYAQPKALGRKVSDEFTVPLCRLHHQELHRNGNEKAWWANAKIAPLAIAQQLWDTSPVHRDVRGGVATRADAATAGLSSEVPPS